MGEQVAARLKERNRRSCLIKIERALESELCRKQGGARRDLISPMLTRISREELLLITGFTSDIRRKRFFLLYD